jgi:hypothetical protein
VLTKQNLKSTIADAVNGIGLPEVTDAADIRLVIAKMYKEMRIRVAWLANPQTPYCKNFVRAGWGTDSESKMEALTAQNSEATSITKRLPRPMPKLLTAEGIVDQILQEMLDGHVT